MAISGLVKALNENPISLKDKKVYIWGTGNTSKLFIEGLERIKDELTIYGYIDSYYSSDEFNSYPVIKPNELNKAEKPCVLICTPRPEVICEISKFLDENDIGWHLLDEYILKAHKDDVIKVSNMLFDDRSKEVFEEIVLSRISGRYPSESAVTENQYFCLDRFSKGITDEVFVDCGAYTGDTVEEFLKFRNGQFKKIISFEPDSKNFDILKSTVKSLADKYGFDQSLIECNKCGISDSSAVYGFDAYEANNGFGSKLLPVSEASDFCSTVSIDEFINEKYTYLKADIESFEYKMLLGAKQSIKKYKPALEICIYHNAVDLYSIPLLIKSFVPEYKIFIRHHTNMLSDTVLYAYI